MLTKIQLKTWTRFPTSNTLNSLQTQSLNHHHLLRSGRKQTPALALRWAITLLRHGNLRLRDSLRQTSKIIPITLLWPVASTNISSVGHKKKGMRTYYDDLLKEANNALRLPIFRHGDGFRKPVASVPDNHALAEWEWLTLEDMRWNDNHQCPITSWSWDIIKRMIWLMQQPPNADCLIYVPQCCFRFNKPTKMPLYRHAHCRLVVEDTGKERYSRIIMCLSMLSQRSEWGIHYVPWSSRQTEHISQILLATRKSGLYISQLAINHRRSTRCHQCTVS